MSQLFMHQPVHQPITSPLRPEDRNLRPAEAPPTAPPYRSEGFFEDLPPAPRPLQH